MNFRGKLFANALILAMLALVSSAFAQKGRSPGTIINVAANNGNFKTLVAAVQAAGLQATLKGEGPFTVFAPTDAAFAKLPAGTVANLLKPENKDLLIKILTYHVVAGSVKASTVVTLDGQEVPTLQGQSILVNVSGGKVSLTDAMGGVSQVVATDVIGTNGVIHVVDTVLIPADEEAMMEETMSDEMTMPEDEVAAQAAMVEAQPSIVDVALGNPNFSTLVAALSAADLVDVLKGEGPFTVFAPTNDAFAKLPAGTVETLLKPENKDLLIKILTYHVVSGKVESGTVVTLNGQKVGTLAGQELTVGVNGGTVTLTDASGGVSTVTAVDVQASNGVIHVIDTVLMPK